MERRPTESSKKIAAFDLDHTLLKPCGKHTFPKNRDDAQLVYPEVYLKLRCLQKEGYKVIIFTNQSGLGKHITVEDIYYKIDKHLPNGHDIGVYISYKSDKYRKPMMGLFDEFMADNGSVTDIFYVGDAAGRKGDHSASDAQFAYNCGIPFYTPEQYFIGKQEEIPDVPKLQVPEPIQVKRRFPSKTVVILIGPPGCGKSTFASEVVQKHPAAVIISNDTSGSADKSLKLYRKALESAEIIIIDNTNATILNRASYSELAKDNGYKVYAVTFVVDRKVASHLNYYRAYTEDKPIVPSVAYASFYKRYEPAGDIEMYDQNLVYVPKYDPHIFIYSF